MKSGMTDDTLFYRALEDRFRGSRELVFARLQVYRPYLMGLLDLFDTPAALDIGCGRGEWLTLVAGLGFTARGIDLDDGMLAACTDQGLAVENGDGVALLADMEDRSLALVTAFHVVEHLPFARVHTLVKEALRVLRPGGLLILETPNPENPGVGAHTFYLDPTHEKPLPPELLAFLPEHCGFRRTRVLRLQEPAGLAEAPCPGLADVLFNASPDYAVVARKAAAPDRTGRAAPARRVEQAGPAGRNGQTVPAQETGRTSPPEDRLDTLFRQTLGIDPRTLAARYDTALTARFNDLERRMDRQWAAHHQERKALADELRLVYGSRSWRITRPLRWAAETGRAARSRYEAVWNSLHGTGWYRRLQRISRPFLSRRSGPDTDPLPPARSSGKAPARTGRKSGEHELSTDELLRRIRKEIDASRQKGDKPE
jgi:O-antigen chain-terminating methyltransferase